MSICVNVCMSKIMHTPIKVGIHSYATYANCWTPEGPLKNSVFRGGLTKTNILGGISYKGGGWAWTVCRSKGEGLAKKRVWYFFGGGGRGVDTPMHIMLHHKTKQELLHILTIAVRKIIHSYIRNLKLSNNDNQQECNLKTSKFSYYLRFPLFCFLKGRNLDFICAS